MTEIRVHARYQYYGTNAERLASSIPAESIGVRWFETDTDSEYIWNGTSWVLPTASTVSGLTSAQVLYGSATGIIAQDTSFQYSDSNLELRINGNNVYGDDADMYYGAGYVYGLYYSDSNNPYILGYRARGSAASPSAAQADDRLMRYSASGYGATGWAGGSRARLDAMAAENWTDANQGTYWDIWVTPTGSITPAVAVRITSAKSLLIGTTTDGLTAGGSLAIAQDLDHRGTKAGFFNVGAIARITTGVAAAAFVANTSGISDDTATFGGYTLGQIAQALQNYGLLT